MRIKMKKTRWILIPLFLIVLLPQLTPICSGILQYNLAVQDGDWVEYTVTEAENWEFFTKITPGDLLRFNIVGSQIHERMYPNTTVAFEVEDAVCDVYLNGELIQENVTLSEMLFYPNGEPHWVALEKIEESWMETAPLYGVDYSSNITIGKDTVLFSSRSGGGITAGFNVEIHKKTGVALEFKRYLITGSNDWMYLLEIKDTNVSGIMTPWYITYWYLILLTVIGATSGIIMVRRSLPDKESKRSSTSPNKDASLVDEQP
jgi:hypothetical protein